MSSGGSTYAAAARRIVAAAALLAVGSSRAGAQEQSSSGGGSVVVGCEPRIVVACVLGTFAGCAVAAALVAVYLFLRRRSRRRLRLGVTDRLAKSPFKSHTNGAFATESSDSIAFTFGQVDNALRGEQRKGSHSKQCSGKHHRQDNGFARGTQDDASQMPQKCVAVDLHSKDFGGLGLDISSSYTEGVFVKELQEPGLAKTCGQIDVGDRIISITVSFENIVYDDAVAILSRASPYYVRLHLLKQPCREQRQAFGLGAANGGLIRGSAADGRGLQHPAFARSQSLSSTTAVTGKLFRESLLCHDNANCQQSATCAEDLDASSDSVASDPLDALPYSKAKRSATLASKTSVTALPGTVRLDNVQAEQLTAALVHAGSSPPRTRGGHIGDGGQVTSGSDRPGGWSERLRLHDKHEPPSHSAPEKGGVRWGGGSHHSSADSISSSSNVTSNSTSSAAIACATAQQEATTATGAAQQHHHNGVRSPPYAHIHATPSAAEMLLQDSIDPHHPLSQGSIVANGELHIHVAEHGFESRLEGVSTAPVAPPSAAAATTAAAPTGWPETDSVPASAGGSLLATAAPVTAVPGRTTARLESVPDATDGRPQRPRHLPTAVMELMQKKEAASVVLDQLEAFATLSRNNNNAGSRYAGQSDELKAHHVANGSVTIGVLQTPEDESSILDAVLSAANLTGDGKASGDEGLNPCSNMQGHDRSALDAEVGLTPEDRENGNASSATPADEIKVLAAKLCSKEGTLRRTASNGAATVDDPTDQRSAEEARALHFSTMLRSAKKS